MSTIPLDINSVLEHTQGAPASCAELLREVLRRIDAYSDPAVWIYRSSREQVESQLERALRRRDQGKPQPLLGVPFAVKDNLDVEGLPTTAACPAFSYVARKTATVVQRLLDAGAILVGKTNMDQFAAGLVGTRSPYGACRNTFSPAYISGGSSSGSAVAVAAGLVSFALGTDTAGSGRVPAAFNNIVGLKPSRGRLSNAGLVPACKSLDCVSIFALSCDDASRVMDSAQGFDSTDPYSRRANAFKNDGESEVPGFRLGVPTREQLQFFGNSEVAALYDAAVMHLKSLGGSAVEIDYRPFARAAGLLYGGPWVAERYLVVKDLLARQPEAILDVTRSILAKGESISAADAFAAMYQLQECCQAASSEWQRMDVLLLPTAGAIYTIDQVLADPIQLNTNLGYYTNFVNLMDLCAVAVPAGFQSNGLPVGVSLIAPMGRDQALLRLGDALHRSANTGTGVARSPLRSSV